MDWEPGLYPNKRKRSVEREGKKAYALLNSCALCARRCSANRLEGKKRFL
ncbi:MAG: hypothetical protein AEth_00361 [Candidatus Argoarchaeum ethanivorans]|uniref:Radical SAM protein n=1 Tax=Candidatus Argoarchaeum ethanivorans TaxID=2608793 RepID=A0A8B6SDH9_9EURY|nr:MAG: hypothetical protein AEth_00361 [Candidatus Argoarchaeum ethanivorans]